MVFPGSPRPPLFQLSLFFFLERKVGNVQAVSQPHLQMGCVWLTQCFVFCFLFFLMKYLPTSKIEKISDRSHIFGFSKVQRVWQHGACICVGQLAVGSGLCLLGGGLSARLLRSRLLSPQAACPALQHSSCLPKMWKGGTIKKDFRNEKKQETSYIL